MNDDMIIELVSLWSIHDHDPANAFLHYTAADPYAVELLFVTLGSEPISYLFARDLLAAGMVETVGQDGDVQIGPHVVSGYTLITLSVDSGDGDTQVNYTAQTRILRKFLRNTGRVVARGCESDFIDIEALAAHVLAGGAR